MTTQKAFASYQEIIDLHTESDKVSVIGLHTPQGDTPRKMFGGFFDQFKKFKYYGCSVSLVPAARLPADPSQVSYEGGEAIIDPRDLMNPLMFHGCHGNDMGVILNRLYALNSLDARKTDSMFFFEEDGDLSGDTAVSDIAGFQLEDLYYKALTDNTWKKAHPQRGFRKSGLRPLVYTMATNMQFLSDGINALGSHLGIPSQPEFDIGGSAGAETVIGNFGLSSANRQFFTPRLTGLGWLDTRNVLTSSTYADEVALTNDFQNVYDMINEANKAQVSEASLPLVYMGMILMPPAYKTEQYFRMIITHHFGFKDFRGISFSNAQLEPVSYAQLNDPDEDYYIGDTSEPDPEPQPPVPATLVFSGRASGIDGFNGYSTLKIDGVDFDLSKYNQISVTGYIEYNGKTLYSSKVFDFYGLVTTTPWQVSSTVDGVGNGKVAINMEFFTSPNQSSDSRYYIMVNNGALVFGSRSGTISDQYWTIAEQRVTVTSVTFSPIDEDSTVVAWFGTSEVKEVTTLA